MTINVFALPMQVPVDGARAKVASLTLPIPRVARQFEMLELSGSLNAITSGGVLLEVRHILGGAAIETLAWRAAGEIVTKPIGEIFNREGDGIQIDILNPGIGASLCYVTFWFASLG